MKIKCKHCERVYKIQENQCPECGKVGGFLQEPAMKAIGVFQIHLEEHLVHTESTNEYQIKEFQANGLICKIVKVTPVQLLGKSVYISNAQLMEYTRK